MAPWILQDPLQIEPFCPTSPVPSPQMDERVKRVRERLLDAADLAIDFLTLGEYGLEPGPAPAGGPTASVRGSCQARRRSGVGLSPIDPGEHLPADFKSAIQHFEV